MWCVVVVVVMVVVSVLFLVSMVLVVFGSICGREVCSGLS